MKYSGSFGAKFVEKIQISPILNCTEYFLGIAMHQVVFFILNVLENCINQFEMKRQPLVTSISQFFCVVLWTNYTVNTIFCLLRAFERFINVLISVYLDHSKYIKLHFHL